MELGRQQRQFRIHHCLGRGGYGEVYRATMTTPGGLQSDVAVKLLRIDLDPGQEAVRRLRDEGRLLALLRHPAILRVFDLAQLDGRIGLVSEFVAGQDLSSLVGVMPLRAVAEGFAAVAEALDEAWNHPRPDGAPLHLVHRDIKPSNIRIGPHGEVKVLDFGIARAMSEQGDRLARTGTGSTVGSLPYMSPERFGRTPPGPAADIYGLGCTLYEMLAARRVHEDAVPVEMFRLAADQVNHDTHVEAALAALPADLPAVVVGLLRQMLAFHVEERPTAHALRPALEALAEGLPGDTLRRWARERVWPESQVVSGGYLDGRVITEGTLTHSGSEHPVVSNDRSSETFRIDLPTGPVRTDPLRSPAVVGPAGARRWLFIAPVVLLLLTVAVVVSAWPGPSGPRLPGPRLPLQGRSGPQPRPPVAVGFPSPVPRPIPAPIVPAPVPVEAEPAVAVVPAKPTPNPVPVFVAEPRPVPEPREPVDSGPSALTYGSVKVVPVDVSVELHAGHAIFSAGRIPVGRYELHADFGYGVANLGRYVDVVEGYQTLIRCNTLRHTCDVAN